MTTAHIKETGLCGLLADPPAGVAQRPPQDKERAIGVALILTAVLLLLIALLVPVWNKGMAGDANNSTGSGGRPGSAAATLDVLSFAIPLDPRSIFLLVALIGGAFGGTVHALASLSAHVGRRGFESERTIWYLTNPMVGAALATIFLFILQAGLLGGSISETSNLAGVITLSTLSGLFGRHALGPLMRIFDAASRTTTQQLPPAAEHGGATHQANGDSGSHSATSKVPAR